MPRFRFVVIGAMWMTTFFLFLEKREKAEKAALAQSLAISEGEMREVLGR